MFLKKFKIGLFFFLIVVIFRLNKIEKKIIVNKFFLVRDWNILVGIIWMIWVVIFVFLVVLDVFLYLDILFFFRFFIFILLFGWNKFVVNKFIVNVIVVIILK